MSPARPLPPGNRNRITSAGRMIPLAQIEARGAAACFAYLVLPILFRGNWVLREKLSTVALIIPRIQVGEFGVGVILLTDEAALFGEGAGRDALLAVGVIVQGLASPPRLHRWVAHSALCLRELPAERNLRYLSVCDPDHQCFEHLLGHRDEPHGGPISFEGRGRRVASDRPISIEMEPADVSGISHRRRKLLLSR